MFDTTAEDFDREMEVLRGPKPFFGWYGILNWANWFTVARIPAAVYATWLYDRGTVWVGVALLIFSALTDLIDGNLARSTGRHSAFGELLDPISDYGMIAWVGFWLVRNEIASWPVYLVGASMLIIAITSSRHTAKTGVTGTSMNAKWGMTFRSAGLGSYVLGDALDTDTAVEVSSWFGHGLVVLGIVFGFVGLADFLKRDGSGTA